MEPVRKEALVPELLTSINRQLDQLYMISDSDPIKEDVKNIKHTLVVLLDQSEKDPVSLTQLSFIKNYLEHALLEVRTLAKSCGASDIISSVAREVSMNTLNYSISFTTMLLKVQEIKSTFLIEPKAASRKNSGITASAETIDRCSACVNGFKLVEQPAYKCMDCDNKVTSKETGRTTPFLCKTCVDLCHKEHNIVESGFKEFVCSCNFVFNSCNKVDICTYNLSGNRYVRQPRYICYSCGLTEDKGSAICAFCIAHCHRDHDIKYIGLSSNFCDCLTGCTMCQSIKRCTSQVRSTN
eukprot:TRINITY_DN12897_c0_g1_i2.p1 TRINITY_DN12897_c0_g1~~TRINITY_DN12897_c0_g1_i2.p1  ORF type:complete len:297 (-),score=6.39 TRINITY_DN12897_c0_g1_i2:231-1121(-)